MFTNRDNSLPGVTAYMLYRAGLYNDTMGTVITIAAPKAMSFYTQSAIKLLA